MLEVAGDLRRALAKFENPVSGIKILTSGKKFSVKSVQVSSDMTVR